MVNCKTGNAFDVAGASDSEGANVNTYKLMDKANQRWKIIYVDEADKDATKGFNKEYGFQINKPFYIVSTLPQKRVVEAIGGNNLVIKSLRRNDEGQQFTWDAVSKTIKNVKWSDKSVTITGAGNGPNMQIFTTNARWF